MWFQTYAQLDHCCSIWFTSVQSVWGSLFTVWAVLSSSCLHVLQVCVWCLSPVRPDERCCAWPAVWSHLTAGTSAGWWELCRGRHVHINEIMRSADSRLLAHAYGSSQLSSLCIFIKVDNGNTGGGGAFNTESSPLPSFYWGKTSPERRITMCTNKKSFQ